MIRHPSRLTTRNACRSPSLVRTSVALNKAAAGGSSGSGQVGVIEAEEVDVGRNLCEDEVGDDDEEWYDDASAEHPDHTLGEEYFEKMWAEIDALDAFGTFRPRARQDLLAEGFLALSSTWVEAWGPEGLKMRFCAREFRSRAVSEQHLFTASSTSTTERIVDAVAVKNGWKTMVIDCKNAYPHVEETEKVYVEAPQVWKDFYYGEGGSCDDVVWELRKLLYGRRKASRCFQQWLGERLQEQGFERCEAQPQLYKNFSNGQILELHQDDGHTTGEDEDLLRFAIVLKDKVVIKSSGLLGVGDEYAYLKCTRRRFEDGTLILPTDRHVDACIRLLKLEGCKPAPTPMSKTLDCDASPDLCVEDAWTYGSVVGILIFFGKYRIDIQGVVRAFSSARRSEEAWKQLKRTVRYLHGTRDEGSWIPADNDWSEVIGFGDTDWGTNKETRCSVACGIVKWGEAPMLGFVRSQKIQALSSGEAEFYGQGSVAVELLLLRRVLAWLMFPVALRLCTDSTAALGIAARSGVGKVKHLQLRSLWLQRFTQSRGPERIQHVKIDTNNMCADIGTKILAEAKFSYLKGLCGLRKSPDTTLRLVKPKLLPSAMSERLGLTKALVGCIANMLNGPLYK